MATTKTITNEFGVTYEEVTRESVVYRVRYIDLNKGIEGADPYNVFIGDSFLAELIDSHYEGIDSHYEGIDSHYEEVDDKIFFYADDYDFERLAEDDFIDSIRKEVFTYRDYAEGYK